MTTPRKAKILVLRPEPGASRTARELARLGHDALVAPAFAVRPLNGGRVPAAPPGESFAGVVAASANAFAMLAETSRAALAGLPALVVGARTAEAAAAAGLAPLRPARRDARDLAGALAETFAAGHLLYLAGRDRRPEIEAALAARRDGFTLAEIYAAARAETLALDACEALRRGEVAAVLHYSRRAAAAYVALAREAGLLAPALAPAQLCLSAGIASVLADEGAARIGTATTPDRPHLLALLHAPAG